MDRVLVPVRQRPMSGDLTDLQMLQVRMLATFLRALGSRRQLAGSGETTDTIPRTFTSGLDVVPSGGGTTITINSGFMGQYSLVWPAALADLEDPLRLGYTRVPVVKNIPDVKNSWMLLEGRMIDQITSTGSYDIMDIVSGNFVPTTVQKRKERQIEYHITAAGDGVTAIPAFTGTPWVPLFLFSTDSAGKWTGATPGGPVMDFRPDINDLLSDISSYGDLALTTAEDRSDAAMDCHSIALATSVVGRDFTANFHGRVAGNRAWFRAQGAARDGVDTPIGSDGYTPTADTIEHLYLVPAISNGIEAWPTITYATSAPGLGLCGAAHKGILLITGTQPIPGGASASANIAHDPGNMWQNFDDAPAHKCLHVTSYYVENPTLGALYYFSQSRGGECIIAANTLGLKAVLTDDYKITSGGTSPTVREIDLAGKIPDNARFAIVTVQQLSIGTRALGFSIVRSKGSTGTAPNDEIFQAYPTLGTTGFSQTYGPIHVPILWDTTAGSTDRKLRLIIVWSGGAIPGGESIEIITRVLGWIY